jgi:hypothetical protein
VFAELSELREDLTAVVSSFIETLAVSEVLYLCEQHSR